MLGFGLQQSFWVHRNTKKPMKCYNISSFLDSCFFEQDTDYCGHDVINETPTNVENSLACKGLCQDNDKCSFWTHDFSGGNLTQNCWLKSSNSGRRSFQDHVSGPKFCSKLNVMTSYSYLVGYVVTY